MTLSINAVQQLDKRKYFYFFPIFQARQAISITVSQAFSMESREILKTTMEIGTAGENIRSAEAL